MTLSELGTPYDADLARWPLVAVTHADGHRWLFMFSERFGLDAPQIESAPVFATGTEPDPELTDQAAQHAIVAARAHQSTAG